MFLRHGVPIAEINTARPVDALYRRMGLDLAHQLLVQGTIVAMGFLVKNDRDRRGNHANASTSAPATVHEPGAR